MDIKPLKTNVLLAQNAERTQSSSGIILDNATSTRDSKTATVLSVGCDVTQVAVGDKVLLDWSKGTVVKVDEAQRVMIKEEFIVAVIE